jgi:hypothetical protein
VPSPSATSRAADGTDPRGVLVIKSLPDYLQRQEDSAQRRLGCRLFGSCVELKPIPSGGMWVRDTETSRLVSCSVDWHTFVRDATDAERALLEHLGHTDLPELLIPMSISRPAPSETGAGLNYQPWRQTHEAPSTPTPPAGRLTSPPTSRRRPVRPTCPRRARIPQGEGDQNDDGARIADNEPVDMVFVRKRCAEVTG